MCGTREKYARAHRSHRSDEFRRGQQKKKRGGVVGRKSNQQPTTVVTRIEPGTKAVWLCAIVSGCPNNRHIIIAHTKAHFTKCPAAPQSSASASLSLSPCVCFHFAKCEMDRFGRYLRRQSHLAGMCLSSRARRLKLINEYSDAHTHTHRPR